MALDVNRARMRIFTTTRRRRYKGISKRHSVCAAFNAEIAPTFSVEHITPQEIEEYVQSAASREADVITALARAKSEIAFGNRFSACPFLVETIRLTESPEEYHRLLGSV